MIKNAAEQDRRPVEEPAGPKSAYYEPVSAQAGDAAAGGGNLAFGNQSNSWGGKFEQSTAREEE